MGREARHRYLKRRGEVWWIRVAVPKALRHLYTSPHVDRTLGTKDVAEAEERKLAHLLAIKQEFRRKLRGETGNHPATVREALEWRKALADETDDNEGAEIIEGLITDRAYAIEAKHGEEAAQLFAARAFGRKTIREAWDEWIPVSDLTPGTVAKYRRALDEFLTYLGHTDTTPVAITGERVRGYVSWLNTKATNDKGEPLDPATKRARVGALSTFWRDCLGPQELVPHGFNPWRGHKFTGARQKARQQKAERPYTDDEILAVVHGPERGKNATYDKRTMLELTALGLYTGARLEELCSRKLRDLEPIRGGYVMHIREAKTPDGVRELPILHPIPVAVIKRRIGKRTDADAFLLAEFIPGGPDNKRSWQVQKALGHYRRAVGLPEGVDFHSTRRTFATRMERRADISNVWVTRYFGHRPPGLLAGVYSGVLPENLRKVARAITYTANVERAFRAALGIK